LFCYLTFLAGPIQQVQDFADQTRRPDVMPLKQAAAIGAPVIATGYFKFIVLAGAFFACFTWSRDGGTNLPAPALQAIGWLSFAGYLYYSFAGYTEVVRGVGTLIGLDLPANFNRPFAATNFLDFWSRWHISLSNWFALYVFNPTVKSLISTDRPALVPYLGAAGYFVTFFLMGLWHGISPRFAMYGLCLGAGVSINKLYQSMMLKRFGRTRFNALIRQRYYAAMAQALALGFFIMALGFLWIVTRPMDQVEVTIWAEAAVLVVAVMLLFSLTASARARFVQRLPRHQGVRVAVCAAQIIVVLGYLLLLREPVPPLLYEFF
jgi:D-alanyl-lipoteichoic acid acyltransferase DltB (MBOAT superfamily)